MTLHFLPFVAGGLAFAISGCTNAVPPAAQLPPPTDCGASLLQDKLGEPVAGSSAADASVGGVPVRSKGDIRVIAPGQAVIENYSEPRLNLEIDGSGNLVRASCG
ncbi:I78 family peptidase inhibitor [Devosia naphthalenivorans]|uniref:I78 family peptidase inhibitor n=1 Tax=Devosia naphthalenivorans TaxID=2082392 RepID=UPI000D3C3445|nr:I78 family peptidase inhibitor [Devosia naphthalenivorans]